MGQIRIGQGLLIICCIFYLIWWSVAFHPLHGDSHTRGIDGILLLITAVVGLLGLTINMAGIVRLPSEKGFTSGIIIVVDGIVAYIILLYGTRIFLHRQVTSELFLIVGWTMLEVASINRAFAWGIVTLDKVTFFLIITAIAAILSLFFYLQYYRVKPMTGYIFGMVPLITEGITMIIFEFLTRYMK